MRKIYYAIMLALCICQSTFSQDEPSAAPKINPFSLSPDNLGAIANSVNLFTGDLALPLNLVSIPGRDGLGIDVSIQYSSANIENISDMWNLEAPTGILGLGWSMAQSQIVVDNKQTGARDDDEFYLIDGGVSTRLICIGNSSGVKTYKTKTYSNKIIRYTYASEKWEIVHEDGSISIYGDQGSNRNTVQWIVRWGNWIGSSNVASGQQRQGFVWNLSEVKNLWGDKITYTYAQAQNFVGSGDIYHTEASYLTRITDSWGREVELVYRNKLPVEYQDPHTEQAEPDAYQERYEKLYLDKILVYADGTNFHEIGLKYQTNLMGSGNLTKRLLKTITKSNPAGVQLPGMTFDYLASGVMKGALTTVNNGIGGNVSFEYSATALTINHSARDLNITAPAGYAEPRVFLEENFIVVTWRQLNGSSHDSNERPVRVFAYSWEGKWRETDLGTFGNVKEINHEQDFQFVSGRDFFAMLRPVYNTTFYWLHIWSKNDAISGGWYLYSSNINLGTHDNTKEKLLAGNDFVAVSNNNGKLFRYIRNSYSSSSWTNSSLDETVATRFTAGTNNYILSLNTAPNPDVLSLYYLDETKNWQVKTLTTNFNSNSNTYLHGSNGMVMGMIDPTNEYIFRWDSDYNLNSYNTGFGYPDNSVVFISNESLIYLLKRTTPRSVRALRFNGASWIDTGDKPNYNDADGSVGEDLILWQEDGIIPDRVAQRKEFNPNSGIWETDVHYTYGDLANPSEVGIRTFAQADKIYFKNTSGSWGSPIQSPLPTGSSPIASSARFGYNYYAGSSSNFLINFIKNGSFSNQYTGSGNYYPRNSMHGYHGYLNHISPYSIVSCPNVFSLDFLNANSLKLHRILNYSVIGNQKDYPITKITLNEGSVNTYKSYEYSVVKSTIDPSGSQALYNLVTTVNGSATPSSKPFGRIETYFFNGLPETELGDTFPQEASVAYVPSYYKLLTGQVYRNKVYNSSGSSVAETSSIMRFNLTPHYFQIIPYKEFSKKDEIEISTFYGFDIPTTIQLGTKRIVTRYSTTQETEVVDLEYTYAWQKYASCQSKNVLSPVVQTKREINHNTYTESIASRWKDWPCTGPNCLYSTIPAPVDQFVWKGTNSSNFTWWDVNVILLRIGSIWAK